MKPESEMTDAEYGAMWRKRMKQMEGKFDDEGLDFVMVSARMIACSAALSNAETAEIKLDGLTYKGEEMGDWTISAKRRRSPRQR